jgi:shikimate kinase
MTPKLILTGFMATGKSAVGPLVAHRLSWRFMDSDAEIVRRAGKPIAEIFGERGEAHFRELERTVIAEMAESRARCAQCRQLRPAVIATGGGALVDDANARTLKRAGVVILLSARAEVIAARVERSRTVRPKLLEGGRPLAERIAELSAERAAAYARADATVDTSDLTPEGAAERVVDVYIEHAKERWKRSA